MDSFQILSSTSIKLHPGMRLLAHVLVSHLHFNITSIFNGESPILMCKISNSFYSLGGKFLFPDLYPNAVYCSSFSILAILLISFTFFTFTFFSYFFYFMRLYILTSSLFHFPLYHPIYTLFLAVF